MPNEQKRRKQLIGKIIDGARTPAEIRKRLTAAGLQFEDLTEEYGYFNLRIPFPDGYFRIYRPTGRGQEIRTQRWRKTEFKYSGIPVFEPSGRRSL